MTSQKENIFLLLNWNPIGPCVRAIFERGVGQSTFCRLRHCQTMIIKFITTALNLIKYASNIFVNKAYVFKKYLNFKWSITIPQMDLPDSFFISLTIFS